MRFTITIPLAVIVALLCDSGLCASANDSVPGLAQGLSDLPADSSVFEVPEGTYRIGSTWTISKPGVTVRGAGIGKTVLLRDPQFNGVMVKMEGANSTISELTLDGNHAAMAISLDQPGVTVDTIEVKNFAHIGIAVPASGCRITKCIVQGFGDPAIQSFGIWRDAGKISTDSTIMIDHNTIKNNGLVGIYCTGGKITIADNQISWNHFYTKVGGGQIDIGNAFATNTAATITGNTVMNGGGIRAGGMELGGGRFTVTGNTIRNHGSAGIGIGHNVIQATITRNTISNSGHDIADRNNPQARSGIYIGYGASNLQIAGNRCFDDQTQKTQTWGIVLVPPPIRLDPRFSDRATEHIVVKQNDLRGNIHPEGLLDQSRARDRSVSANLP